MIRPNTFEDKVAILETNTAAAMVYGPTQMWFSWTGKAGAVDGDQVFTPAVPLNSLIPPPEAMLAFVAMSGTKR